MVPIPLQVGVGEVDVVGVLEVVMFKDVELVMRDVNDVVVLFLFDEGNVEVRETVPVLVDVSSGFEVIVIVVTDVEGLCDKVTVKVELQDAVDVVVDVSVKVFVSVNI